MELIRKQKAEGAPARTGPSSEMIPRFNHAAGEGDPCMCKGANYFSTGNSLVLLIWYCFIGIQNARVIELKAYTRFSFKKNAKQNKQTKNTHEAVFSTGSPQVSYESSFEVKFKLQWRTQEEWCEQQLSWSQAKTGHIPYKWQGCGATAHYEMSYVRVSPLESAMSRG